MHFICVFLILVPTLDLAESEAISDLKHYKEATLTFQGIDTNNDGFIVLEELAASFDVFKKKPGDSNITRKRFVDLLFSDGTSKDVAGKLFVAYDLDRNGVLNASDYSAQLLSFDANRDGRISSEELIRRFNDILINAGADVRQI